MRLIPREFSWHQKRLAKAITPFLAINVIASLIFLLWPIAIPVFCAEFCLLAIWSAWGPGIFWKRFLACLVVGMLCFLSQLYLWIILFTVTADIRVVLVLVQWLFSAWILAQIPLWGVRYIWNVRISDHADHDLEPFLTKNIMIGMTMICMAFAVGRWSTEYLTEEFGPFRFEKAFAVFGLVFLEIYLMIGIAGLGTYFAFRTKSYPAKVIPLVIVGALLAGLSAWIWFSYPEAWFAAGLFWMGGIMFAWAIILPINHVKGLGYGLYRGTCRVGDNS